MKIYVINRRHFYKGLSNDLNNINKLIVKHMNDTNLLDTLKNHSQFQMCGILKL
jgi:hypothetical protein